jgi:hypothetical protein
MPIGTIRNLVIIGLCLGGCDKPSSGTPEVTTAYTNQGIVVASSGGFEDRIKIALSKVATETVGKAALETIAKNKGSVIIDDPSTVRGIPEGTEVAAIHADAAIGEILSGLDEIAAADLLYKKGIHTLILHSEVAPSVDRGARVLSRLYYHDHLVRFQLFRVSEGLLFYRVRKKPVTFDEALAKSAIRYLRAKMSKQPTEALPDVKSNTGSWTFVASIRGQGRELSIAFAQDRRMQKALDELAEDLEKVHRRRVEYFGFAPLEEHMADLRVELQRVTERAFVEPRSEAFLQRFMEMGMDGAFILTKDRKERGVLPGSVSFTQSIKSADKFLREAAKQGRMGSRRPWRGADSWLEIFRTIHYIETKNGGVERLIRGVTEVPLHTMTLGDVRQGIIEAGEWYLANLQDDGTVIYKFWPSENRYSNEYNHVRHTLATWNMVQAYEMEPRPEFLEGAERALKWSNKYLKYETNAQVGEMAFYSYKNNQKLGSVVVNMLGIVDLARATGNHEWDELLKQMGNFTKFMQEPSGKFRGYYVDKGHSYFGQTNDIVPGEAALALVFLADYFDDDSWIEPLKSYWTYYKPWFRERAAKVNWDAPWPAHIYTNATRLELVQFGPWTVMAANAYHRRTGDMDAAKFGLEVARWMIEAYQWNEERSPWPDYVGGYYKLPGELPAMQAFCYAEGTAAAYALALRAVPEEAAFFEKSTREAVRIGLQMQYNEVDVYAFSRPRQVFGGIRYALNETKVRIDYVHHALSAMYQYYNAAKTDPAIPEWMKAPQANETPSSEIDLEWSVEG